MGIVGISGGVNVLNIVSDAVTIIEQIVVVVVVRVNGPELEPEIAVFLGRRFKWINVAVVSVPNDCGGNKFLGRIWDGNFVSVP